MTIALGISPPTTSEILNVNESKSVAVIVPIAVWFSGTTKLLPDVNTGSVVSIILTVLATWVSLPAASVAV